MELEDLSFQFLWEVTGGFSEKIGEGAFGVVYKGVTKDRENVAVKLLTIRDPNLDSMLFQNELDNLKKLSHPNIVQVLGYCYEAEKKPFFFEGNKVVVDEMHIALCFEYLQNGSLRNHLDDKSFEPKLEWHTCFKIIKGTCEGLKYIHKDLEKPMYHLDLKPDNILLDKDMLPKIADFGLSRIFGEELTRTTSRPYGTPGYQPPEYIDKGEISGKYDIFSLGVIIIRIVSGHASYPQCLDIPSDEFIDQVLRNWRERLLATSSSDSLLEAYCHQVTTCTQIALSCLENDNLKRPDIVNITEKLNDIEADIGKLATKGCHTASEITMHTNNKEIRGEPKDIIGQQQSIVSSISCSELELVDARETSSDIVEELIVGRTEEKDEIINSLLHVMSKKIVILPIHGIGGIGKTTFARLIYNDPNLKHYSHVWVHVSQRFDLNKIGDSIITQISEKESPNERQMENNKMQLKDKLVTLLHGKRIMIVLDDLWEDNQMQLNELKEMLYNDGSNIIILVTTRSERVAERIWTNIKPYKILPLTNDMCWDIIKQRSGVESRDDKEQLACIGQEIAQKCGGVALAARSLGFTLRDKNFDQWMEVKDNEIWNEPTSNVSLPNQVVASLKLSCNYLEQGLKECFTYCAVFPKGHKIVRKDLIYQWISLGFIKPKKLLSILQHCEKYIVQLLGLSFLQVLPEVSELCHQQATFFTMHDLVHDLAVSLLGNKLLDKSKQENNLGTSNYYQYALLGDCSVPMWLSSAAELIALRFLDCGNTQLHGAAFAPATSLRVLDLTECSIGKLPDSIGELKELRYLSAPRVRDWKFPECITKLSHLIYLNLHGSNISALPESIGEMKGLMHLDLSGCKGIMQLPCSSLSLTKLVHLDFSDCSQMTDINVFLWHKSGLEHLSLSGCAVDTAVATELCDLTELKYLDLSQLNLDMRCKEIGFHGTVSSDETFGGLQQALVGLTKLRYLDVSGVLNKVFEYEHDTSVEAISKLSSLEYLNISRNNCLRNIPESFGNLRKLRTLDLSHCVNLQRLPACISLLDNLKFVLVSGCNRLDKSTLALYKNVTSLPYFVVQAGDIESRSNLCQLEHENPTKLEMSRLENVKSSGEAQRIKLVEKKLIRELGLVWTRDARRFVMEDKDVLEQLVPPCKVKQIRMQGYNSVSFPSWMLDFATYVPHLVEVTLEDMPNCSSLPPLGQLPNLQKLRIGRMDSIRKIGQDLFGDRGLKKRAFPQLMSFKLQEMKCLEEWNTSYSYPNLRDLVIKDCPMLKLKSSSPLALGKNMSIICSGQVLLSSWECRRQFYGTSSTATTSLCIERCEAPLHQWSMLRQLPYLETLTIHHCSDLTCSSTDLLRCLRSLNVLAVRDCRSIAALPERLGDLTSLHKLEISNCPCVKALPESIQQLTRLHSLEIYGCPQLVQLGCPPSLETLSIKGCKSIDQLAGMLGDLTSLKKLVISNCEGVSALPESIQQLTRLQCLQIYGSRDLIWWCKSEDNKLKLAHIKEIILYYS